MEFLETVIKFITPLAVTLFFILYFNGTIAGPLFSLFKNRDFESALSMVLTLLFIAAGLNVADDYLDIRLLKPLVSSALVTFQSMLGCLMQLLPVAAYFFIGYAILCLANAVAGKHNPGGAAPEPAEAPGGVVEAKEESK